MKILTLIWFKFRFFEKNLLSGHLSLEPIFISWWQVKVIMGLKKFFDEKLHQKLFLTIDYYYQYVVILGGNLLQMLIGMRHFGKFLHLYY